MYVILRYLFVLSLPLMVPGSIFYYFIAKSLPRAFLYYASGYVMCLFVTNVLLLIYSFVLRNFKAKRLSTLYLYSSGIVNIFSGYRIPVCILHFCRQAKWWCHFILWGDSEKRAHTIFPQAWFGFIPVRQNFYFDFRLLVKAILPVFISYFAYLSLKIYLAENYGKIRERVHHSRIFFTESRAISGGFSLANAWNCFIEKFYIRNKIEQSSFTLLKIFFKREKAVKLNILPMIMIPGGIGQYSHYWPNSCCPRFGKWISEKTCFSYFHNAFTLSCNNYINAGNKNYGKPAASWVYDSFSRWIKKKIQKRDKKIFYSLFDYTRLHNLVRYFFSKNTIYTGACSYVIHILGG